MLEAKFETFKNSRITIFYQLIGLYFLIPLLYALRQFFCRNSIYLMIQFEWFRLKL